LSANLGLKIPIQTILSTVLLAKAAENRKIASLTPVLVSDLVSTFSFLLFTFALFRPVLVSLGTIALPGFHR
jgi:hypothetical protein